MTESDGGREPGPIVLSPAGPDAWRAIDSSYPLTDARCLIAYVEALGDRYLVLSLVPPLGGVTEVDTLAEAETVVRHLRMQVEERVSSTQGYRRTG